MRYAKGHGTGNDFIIVPDLDDQLELGADVVRRLCDRHEGIGADGVLRVVSRASDPAPWFMDYRNADGSIAEMCGNGIRVFARYLLERGLAAGPSFAVATRSGVRQVRVEPDGRITVGMGPVSVLGPGHAVIAGSVRDGLRISVGNPHLACLVDDALDKFDLAAPPGLDPADFPAGGNVERVQLADRARGDRGRRRTRPRLAGVPLAGKPRGRVHRRAPRRLLGIGVRAR